jgi:hypothetical protein
MIGRRKGRTFVMLMKARERWHCTNLACRCQVVVEISGEARPLYEQHYEQRMDLPYQRSYVDRVRVRA